MRDDHFEQQVLLRIKSMRICNTSEFWHLLTDWLSNVLDLYLRRLCQKVGFYQQVGLNYVVKSTFYFVTKTYLSHPIVLYFYLSSFNHQYFSLLLSYFWGQYLYFLLKYFKNVTTTALIILQ